MRRRTTPPSDLHLAIAVYRLCLLQRIPPTWHSDKLCIPSYAVFSDCVLQRQAGAQACRPRLDPLQAEHSHRASYSNTRTRMQRSSIQGASEGTLGLQSCTGRAIRLIAAIARLPRSVSAVAPHGDMSTFSDLVSVWCDSVFNLDPAIPLLSL